MKEVVRKWKRQRREVFVPLVYKPSDLGEVDFFEVLVDIDGERRKAHMFVMRLMHSGRNFAWLYPRQDQTCFLDGYVRAFAHFGAIPHRVVYYNLKAAVRKILVGSERELSTRFLALANHYAFEAITNAELLNYTNGVRRRTGATQRSQIPAAVGSPDFRDCPFPTSPGTRWLGLACLDRVSQARGWHSPTGRLPHVACSR